MDEILTVFQASKYCSVSPKTIINWIEAGHIEAYKTVGGHRRIKRADLEAFMRRQGIPIPEEEIVTERKRILIVDDDPIIVRHWRKRNMTTKSFLLQMDLKPGCRSTISSPIS
jgi:excisionase family DNA binding protein